MRKFAEIIESTTVAPPTNCLWIKGNDALYFTNGKWVSLFKKEDFINITDRFNKHSISLIEAIQIVPTHQRIDGLVITFEDINGDWRIYQFRGDAVDFFDENKWTDLYDYTNYIVKSITPDEEDLTVSKPDKNGNAIVSLKDRVYDESNFSVKGYKILRKNIQIIDGVRKNILTQDMINKPNTIYEIRYDFDLGGESVEIPSDCVLYFKGGQLTSGNITGDDTILDYNSPFLSNVILNGSFKVNKDIVKDTDIFIDSNFNTNRIKSVLNVYSNSARIEFTKAIYNDITSIKVSRNIDVNFNESIINLYVNPSTSLADNFLYMEKHSRDFGSVLDFVKVKNVVIKGNPNCVYNGTSSFIGTGAYRRAIQLFNVDYVKLENVTLSNFNVGSSGTYAQSYADRYELSSISIFYYNKVELMNLEIHDCKSDNHVMLVPNINPNNKAIVEGCKCYNTYTGLLMIFDGRCEVYDCIVKDFYSSAFNLFCYDSLIHNNTFINGSRGACIDVTEWGEYLSKDIKIYDNYNRSLYTFCIISGKNIVVDNNYSDGGVAVGYCYPKTNVANSENNPSFEDFGNFVISNNNFISSDSVITYYGSKPAFINDRHIESFYIKGNIIKCTNPNFSLSGEHSPIVLVALENVIVDSNTLIGYGRTGVSSIFGSIISIGGGVGVGSFGYLIVSNNIVSYTPTDGKSSYFISALYVPDNYTISVKNNELLSDFTLTLRSINTIINVKSSGNINAPDLIDKHVNITNLNFVLEKGESSYNVSANKPIWWTGVKWVDATGADA